MNTCATEVLSNGTIAIRISAPNQDALPQYASKGASGADIKAYIEESITILPGARALIPTGISMEIPEGYEVQLRPRSGLALKHGITLTNTPATIDSDYRGEIKVILMNLGSEPFIVTPGMRIAQMVVAKVEIATFLLSDNTFNTTTRGINGFGHTGTH